MKERRNIFNKAHSILAAKLCFLVFFTKMLISATPMFVDVVDKGTILQVVLQLELEMGSNNNNANNEDLHEHGVKIHKPDSYYFSFNPTVENNGKVRNYQRNEKTILSYHPEVPTPPPNC